MTIRERILCALTWGDPDRIPLTIYDQNLPRGAGERQLREAGVGLIHKVQVNEVEYRQIEIISREYFENGCERMRRTIHTPVGEVWQTLEPDPAYGTSNWIREHFIKRPEDYEVMEFYLRDLVYHDNCAAIREAQRQVGDDGIVMARIGRSPLQEMLYEMMGYERFAVDYYENRDLFDGLHATLVSRHEEIYALAAKSPAEIFYRGDNITADVIGAERYRSYLMPEYAKLTALLRGTGKLLAVHMDGHLHGLVDQIAAAKFDIIEGMTPPPMGDVSIREARRVWPGKILWINFTSSVHLESPRRIEAHTRQLVSEAGNKRGFLISVTEDAPPEALARSLGVVARVLREMA